MMGTPVIATCVTRLRENRIREATNGIADLVVASSFTELRILTQAGGFSALIVDPRDPAGVSLDTFARETGSRAGPLVLYASAADAAPFLATPGIQDWIVAGQTDAPALVRALVRRLLLRAAADSVVAALGSRLRHPIASIAELAVRHPECATVEGLAERIGVHRGTMAGWCRNACFIRPEELIVWARVLLVSAALEQTRLSVMSLATDLGFPSAVALRNQLKRYTGATAMEIRATGLSPVLARFDAFVAGAASRRDESAVRTATVG